MAVYCKKHTEHICAQYCVKSDGIYSKHLALKDKQGGGEKQTLYLRIQVFWVVRVCRWVKATRSSFHRDSTTCPRNSCILNITSLRTSHPDGNRYIYVGRLQDAVRKCSVRVTVTDIVISQRY